jgi:very-short-patch-repair endonuclease
MQAGVALRAGGDFIFKIMKIKYQPYLKSYSQKLRKEMTDAERFLWRHIRMKQISNLQFYRQRPIGKHIVDFYCPNAKIIIELDGSQHFEQKNLENDKIRDAYLKNMGLKVLRFNDLEVLKNIEGVIGKILMEIK